MLGKYNEVKASYIEKGFGQTLELIEQCEPQSCEEEVLYLNVYVYLLIEQKYRLEDSIQLLFDCLEKQCQSSLRALTKYQISKIYFILNNFESSREFSQQVINQFYGEYYILKNRQDNSERDQIIMAELAEILCYSLQMLTIISKITNKENQAVKFGKAATKLIKENSNISFNSNLSTNNSHKNRQNITQNAVIQGYIFQD